LRVRPTGLKSFNLDSAIPSGKHYILLYADGTGVVAESNENNNATSGAPLTITTPPAATLFPTGADVVDFNNLKNTQQTALQNGADPFHGLGGNDSATLPSEENFDELIGGGKVLSWTNDAGSTFYTGSLKGQTYTVSGTDGDYYINGGAGTDKIIINGDGSSQVSLGAGIEKVTINGTAAPWRLPEPSTAGS
jgi:hypothetical protein